MEMGGNNKYSLILWNGAYVLCFYNMQGLHKHYIFFSHFLNITIMDGDYYDEDHVSSSQIIWNALFPVLLFLLRDKEKG